MITFLQPGAMFLAAGLLVPALLVLYILRLRRRPLRVSAAFLWLEAARDLQVNTPFARFRATLLLLLHLLIIACLIVALGRPAIDMPASGQRVLLVIDASASMNAAAEQPPAAVAAAGNATLSPAPRTRLDLAKRRALELAETFIASEAKVAIADFASTATLRSIFTADLNILRDAIDGIAPTDDPGRLDRLDTLVASLAAAASSPQAASTTPDSVAGTDPTSTASNEAAPARRPLPLRTFVLTDQANPKPPAPGAADAPSNLDSPSTSPRLDQSILPIRGIVPVAAGEPINIGITQLSARRDERDPSLVRLFIKAASTGGITAAVPVSITIDGVPAAETPRLLTLTRAADAPPGTPAEAAVVVPITLPRGGLITATLGIRDALATDNSASVNLPKQPEPRVLVVAPDAVRRGTAAAGGPAADPVLLALLRELVTPGAPAAPATSAPLQTSTPPAASPRTAGSVTVISQSAFAATIAGLGTSRTLPEVDLLVFDRVAVASDAGIAAIPSLHLGATVRTAALDVQVIPATSGRTSMLTWNRQDALMRFVTPEDVTVSTATSLSIAPGTASRDIVSLIDGQSGPLVVASAAVAGGNPPAGTQPGRTGRIRRVATSFPISDSTWPPDVSFVVFMSNVIETLTGSAAARTGIAIATGEPLLADLPAGRSRPVDLLAPAPDSRVIESTTLAEASTLASFAPVSRVGIYEVRDRGAAALLQDAPAFLAMPVSLLNAAETDLLPGDDASPDAAASGTTPDAAKLAGPTVREPRELWDKLLLALVALLALEWLVYGLKARH